MTLAKRAKVAKEDKPGAGKFLSQRRRDAETQSREEMPVFRRRSADQK
jgi:hypothetical protein